MAKSMGELEALLEKVVDRALTKSSGGGADDFERRLTRVEGRLDRVSEALDRLSVVDERVAKMETDRATDLAAAQARAETNSRRNENLKYFITAAISIAPILIGGVAFFAGRSMAG